MGCWLSKKTEDPSLSSTNANKGKREKNNSGGAGGESRDPPPTESPQPQEEKVKEVLSETPKITSQRSVRNINSNNVNNIIDINGGAKRKTIVDDDDEYYPATIRSEVETSTSTTAASEQSTTATKTTFTDKKKKKKKKKKPAGGGGAFAGGGGGGGREIRGSVVDVGCRSARSSSSLSSPSPQLLIRAPWNLSSSGGNAAGGVMIRNKCNSNSNRSSAAPSPMKISGDLGERSRRRSVSPSPSASASASAIKRCASAAPVPPMDQRLCRLMSSSAATATTRVNNGRHCSPRKIPATTASRPVVDLVNGDRPVPAPAPANWNSGKLLEAPHPSPGSCPPDNHDHGQAREQQESLENPLVSLECFIFL